MAKTPMYRYGDLEAGVRRLAGQVNAVNAHIEVLNRDSRTAGRRPSLTREKILGGYARRWMRHYGFTSKFARVPKHHEKNVKLATTLIEEARRA